MDFIVQAPLVFGRVGRVSKVLRRIVGGSSPVATIVLIVIVVMLMLSVLVVDNLGRVGLLQVYPEPGSVDEQAEDGDREEFQLEVGGDQLKQQAEFRLEQHRQTQELLELLLLLAEFLSTSFH